VQQLKRDAAAAGSGSNAGLSSARTSLGPPGAAGITAASSAAIQGLGSQPPSSSSEAAAAAAVSSAVATSSSGVESLDSASGVSAPLTVVSIPPAGVLTGPSSSSMLQRLLQRLHVLWRLCRAYIAWGLAHAKSLTPRHVFVIVALAVMLIQLRSLILAPVRSAASWVIGHGQTALRLAFSTGVGRMLSR